MKNKTVNTDFVIFALCLISLMCIAARIVFTIIQLNASDKLIYVKDAQCTVDQQQLDIDGKYLLYGMWEYYPEQHICSSPSLNSDKGSSVIHIPVQWNMFDDRFWNTSGLSSYRMTITIPGDDSYILYLHGMPSHSSIYIDRRLCPPIDNYNYLFNGGVEIPSGQHEIVIEFTSDWLTGFYAFPWLYTHSEFQKQASLSQGIWEISIGGFIIATLYGAIFLRKSKESLFFKRQIINTGLFFIFYQLTFCEYSLDVNLLSKFVPISKIHIITLISAIILGVHTIKMYRERLSDPIIRRILLAVTNIFFAILLLKMFINPYVNLQFIEDVLVMFIAGIILLSFLEESGQNKHGIVELSLSVLLIGTDIVTATSANMQNFFSEVYYTIPLTFMLTLLCYGYFIATEFAHIEKEAQTKRYLEQQLIDAKMAYLTSQIQPHFQYNTLAMIQELCYSNPQRAADAIVKFSSVLRRRVDFNRYSQLEPFADELACIEDYIDLQRMRFGDMLIYIPNIQYTDFMIPPLSIQTLIENAVYHGIRKKKSSGSLTLETHRNNNFAEIIIMDNGVGFDTEILSTTSGNGIRNSQARIESLTGGTLDIASTPGVGTTVTIRIPIRRTV